MNIVSVVIWLFVLLLAITIHEAAHGWAAMKLGDPTAYNLGRVSLNPLAHIDPIGTVLIPLVLVLVGAPPFGWAKPVPVNPYNLRRPRQDNLWISAAGPLANLTLGSLALIGIVILKLLAPGVSGFLHDFLVSGHTLPSGLYPLRGLAVILFYLTLTNVYLAVFNLIPVPPLDGSGILTGLLSYEAALRYERLRPFGFFIVLGLIYLGVLQVIIRPIEIFIYTIVFL
jgi:Zn-dependent protease